MAVKVCTFTIPKMGDLPLVSAWPTTTPGSGLDCEYVLIPEDSYTSASSASEPYLKIAPEVDSYGAVLVSSLYRGHDPSRINPSADPAYVIKASCTVLVGSTATAGSERMTLVMGGKSYEITLGGAAVPVTGLGLNQATCAVFAFLISTSVYFYFEINWDVAAQPPIGGPALVGEVYAGFYAVEPEQLFWTNFVATKEVIDP